MVKPPARPEPEKKNQSDSEKRGEFLKITPDRRSRPVPPFLVLSIVSLTFRGRSLAAQAGSGRFLCRGGSLRGSTPMRYGASLPSECRLGSCSLSFALQCSCRRPTALGGWVSTFARVLIFPFGLLAGFFRHTTPLWRWQFHPGPSRLGKPDCDSLLGRTGTMFALADVLHFLAYKFAGLCRWRLALPLRGSCSFDSLLFWHKSGSL
jgi:hypothetical protein